MMLLQQMLQLFWKKDPRILFSDTFDGSALNTNFWTITDTESKITVTGGNLDFSGGLATPAWADPAAVSRTPHFWARRAGLTIEWQITPTATNTEFLLGFTDGSLASNAAEAHGIYVRNTGSISAIVNAATGIVTPFAYSAATSYWCRIVCLATGAHYYISTDNRVTWYLVWIDTTVTTTPLYAFIESYNAALTASKCEVRLGSVVPALLSASPAAPSLGLGSELFVDPGLEGNYTVGLNDNLTKAGSPTVAQSADVHGGSKAQEFTGAAQNDLLRQNYTGTAQLWYVFSVWAKRTSGTGGTVKLVFADDNVTLIGPALTGATYTQYAMASRATSVAMYLNVVRETNSSSFDTVIIDDASMKNLAFSTSGCLTYIGDAGKKLGIGKANITVGDGYHAGFVVCADSATAPTNCLYVYYDRTGGKAYLMKVTAGVTAELVAATVAYGAANELRIVITGPVTAARVGFYYGSSGAPSLQGTIQGPYDLSSYGSHVFGFQTSSAETVASFTFDGGINV